MEEAARPSTLPCASKSSGIAHLPGLFYARNFWDMQSKEVKPDGEAVTLVVTEELAVTVLRQPEHQWLMSTEDVARGYGVDRRTISAHQSNHRDETFPETVS